MSRSEFYKSRAGAEGFKTFFQFLSLPPITQKFPKGKKRSGEKRSCSLWNKLQRCESEVRERQFVPWKAKCFSFRSRDWKDAESIAKKFPIRKLSEDQLNIPNRSAMHWEKHWPSLLRCTSVVNIYIYIIFTAYTLFYSYRGDSLT